MVTNGNILETTGEGFLFVTIILSEQLFSSLTYNKCFGYRPIVRVKNSLVLVEFLMS